MRAFNTSFMLGRPGWVDDGTIAESARAPFHAALKPSHDIALGHLIGNRVEQRSAIEPPILYAGAFQRGFDLRFGKFWAEVGVVHLPRRRGCFNTE